MGTRVLIVLVVIIVLLAVVAIVLSANRGKPADEKTAAKDENPPAFASLLDGAFGWMAPSGFDLKDLGTVQGAVLDRAKRTLKFTSEQQVTIRILPEPKGTDPNACRSLTLVMDKPALSDKPGPLLDLITGTEWVDPPSEFEEPEFGQVLPNPKVKVNEWTNTIDETKRAEFSLPVFVGGATIVLMPKKSCTVKIR